VKSEIWIFVELARRLGLDWEHRTSREIWEGEILSEIPRLSGITYDGIEDDGMQWSALSAVTSPLSHPKRELHNYHHRQMCEQCDGLLELLPRTRKSTAFPPVGNKEEVNRKFMALLETDKMTEQKELIDKTLAAYRSRPGGLIPVLQKVQEILGYLPIETQNYIANGLGIPASDVFGVTSFYSFFTMVRRGKHIVRVCLGTACYVKGADKIVDNLKKQLNVEVGATTEDRMFTLEAVRCVGACGLAPVVVVGEDTHGLVDPFNTASIVEKYRSVSDEP
jgi:NADH:ubiquinone oxidoreductase subunit E